MDSTTPPVPVDADVDPVPPEDVARGVERVKDVVVIPAEAVTSPETVNGESRSEATVSSAYKRNTAPTPPNS